MIFSWEGILVLIFIAVNIFCALFSEFYNLSSLLRQMPVYLAEVFLMLTMAYILVLGEIGYLRRFYRVSLCYHVLYCMQYKCPLHCRSTYGSDRGNDLRRDQRIYPYEIPGTSSDDRTLATQIIFRVLPRSFWEAAEVSLLPTLTVSV